MSGSSVVVPSREQIANYGPALAQALVDVATAAKADLDELIGGGSVAPTFQARAVATSLQASGGSGTGVLTESANGALAAQDGVTIAVGDQIFIQEGTANVAAKDCGPWVVTALGAAGAKWVLTRPSWWPTGATINPGKVIEIGGEGTLWKGTSWKTFVVAGKIVDTDAPAFYPRYVAQAVTLASGTATISNVPLLSATKSIIDFNRTTPSGTASTVEYNPITLTPGVTGTASIVINAQVAAGTINAADGSTFNVGVTNW